MVQSEALRTRDPYSRYEGFGRFRMKKSTQLFVGDPSGHGKRFEPIQGGPVWQGYGYPVYQPHLVAVAS